MQKDPCFYYAFDTPAQQPKIQRLSSTQLGKTDFTNRVWIHVTLPSKIMQNSLKKHIPAPSFVWENLFAEETRPRSISADEGQLLILRGINLNPGAAPDDMVSLRIWVTPQYLITVSMHHVMSVSDACKYISEQQSVVNNSIDCLLLIIDCLFEHIGEAIYAIETGLDNLEENMDSIPEEQIQQTIVNSRQAIITYRRHLLPQRDAILKIPLEKLTWISKVQANYIHDLGESMTRFVEDINAARERASVLQDSVTNKLAERANNKIYVLSIITLIFMPPSFITGLFGMNIIVPGQTSKITFWIVCTVMTALTAWLFIYFKKNEWL